jgi:hypothetical protein
MRQHRQSPSRQSPWPKNFPYDSEVSAHGEGKSLRLEWMGPRAFQSRYGVQPGVDRDFRMWWRHRHD